MRIEYEIEVAESVLDNPLTAEELYAGLVLRALEPMRVNENISACELVLVSATQVRRRLNFGALQLEEDVSLYAHQGIMIVTHPSVEQSGGCVSLRIVLTEEDRLAVRFVYERPEELNLTDEEKVLMPRVLRQMYYGEDQNFMAVLRKMAAQGLLKLQ
ncbi:MAG: DUF1857 family protein [Neisseriaceae bacterium]|nr:DUF1857 family protein [Neisseriaceae bacterium]